MQNGLVMNKLLACAALGEAATGLALMAVPSLVGRLLLGVELSGVAAPIARVTGIALLALSLACWPGAQSWRPLGAMVLYSTLVTLLLFFLGMQGKWVGPLLWPAVAVHAILTALLGRAGLAARKLGVSSHKLDRSPGLHS